MLHCYSPTDVSPDSHISALATSSADCVGLLGCGICTDCFSHSHKLDVKRHFWHASARYRPHSNVYKVHETDADLRIRRRESLSYVRPPIPVQQGSPNTETYAKKCYVHSFVIRGLSTAQLLANSKELSTWLSFIQNLGRAFRKVHLG